MDRLAGGFSEFSGVKDRVKYFVCRYCPAVVPLLKLGRKILRRSR